MNSARFEQTANRPILLIDDDAEYSHMVIAALNGLGCDVIAAQDGLEGIEVARAAQPAVILLDRIIVFAQFREMMKQRELSWMACSIRSPDGAFVTKQKPEGR